MMDGFDVSNPLVCEGIIGDGCGGGRLFFVENEKLFAYDPTTQEKLLLLSEVHDAVAILKKSCIISIETKTKTIQFNLSTLKKVDAKEKM